MPAIAAPDLERAFSIEHATTALVIFTIPGIVALVLEPFVFLLADRYPRRWFVAGGLAVLAASAFASALAPSIEVLAIAQSVWGVAGAAAISLAQATLVDRATDPNDRARIMTRWTMCALAGDICGPILLAALAAFLLDWRAAFAIVGVVLAVFAILLALRPLGDAPRAGDDEPSLWQSLRAALRDRVLVLWLFGMTLCDLLDEILVVFASLHVRAELGAGPTWQAVILGAFMIGGAIGLVVLDRLLARKVPVARLLVACGLACAAAYTAWIFAPTLWLSAVLMLPVGATSAPLYPMVAAIAYARFPGRSGTVLAASHMFAPLSLALPFAIGVVADAAGTHAALGLLVAQPLALALLAMRTSTT